MSVTTTTHYGLKKPDGSEAIKPDPFNDNSDLIDEQLYKNSVLTGTTAPTTSTAGAVGQFYLDTNARELYQCMTQGPVYTWKPVLKEWKLLQAYTTAGSYTFTTPSGITELGAFIIGGGGSGTAQGGGTDGDSWSWHSSAYGGASGYTARTILTGPLSASYSVVVGAGGASASYGSAITSSQNGSSSSFAGVTAAGGGAGNSSGAGGGQRSHSGVSLTIAALGEVSNGAGTPLQCLNPFDNKRLLLAGGNAAASISRNSGTYVETDNVTYEQAVNDDYGNIGSAGKAVIGYSATAAKGTSYGCGGAGVACIVHATAGSGSFNVVSAAGCDGAVLIYGR